ncbi:BRO-N domain-containing protein [Thiothrix nivea]|uniref:Prophage antirepressor n=1 Tax=Thiothrix nivea (strain ATCC 35100 / DSM 5205 / JP2) TaxID=870187 RepID=A0A656HED4_THINJ|nr:BRO family protein [Thiothrix nivea]EIJ35278.1 prophage antirepressor [Thiothrix nivea DSM 5205]
MNNSFLQVINDRTFNFKDTSLTILTDERDNSIWFIGKEVATALGYTDTKQAVRTHCRGGVEFTLPSNSGEQIYKIIPESDVYRLIMKSQKQEAEAFQDWVTEEVLPSIRRTGSYSAAISSDLIESSNLMDTSFKLFESAHKVALLVANDSNLAAIAANKAVMRTTTVNVLDKLDMNYLTSTKQEARIGAKDIAKRITGLTVRAVNPLLVDMGYLTKGTSNRCPWELTESGKEYGVYSDTSTNNLKSFQVQSVHWYESIIPKIEEYLNSNPDEE